MTDLLRPAPKPCASCPYRQDVPSGIWSETEYDKLREFDNDTACQPTALFQCHQNDGGDTKARLCAGWVACHGNDLLALRLASAFGSMQPAEVEATFDYTTSVPVFASGAEAAEHGIRDIECPDEDAEEAIEKIMQRRSDIRMG